MKIIFDTDMVEDYDDVGALALLHTLADKGECEILAVGTCTRDNSSVAAVEVINSFYGRPDIPVGCSKGMGVVGTPRGDVERKGHQKYVRLAKEYAQWVKHANSNDAPDANDVYRAALAAAPDHSVTFCSVGFLTNMRRLLETAGDRHSPLTGRELVAKKVKCWYAMACKYPDGTEYNSMHDWRSSAIALAQWPTPIVYSDWNYGRDCYCGRGVAEKAYPARNPVHDIFAWSLPTREAVRSGKTFEKDERGRNAWDESTVLAAVRGIEPYFKLQRGTYRMVGEKGANVWTDDPSVAGGRLVDGWTKAQVGQLMDDLIAEGPKK